MLEKLIDLDKELLIFLNNLGSPTFDGLWLVITKQLHWIPFFLFVFYLLQKKIGWKNFGYYVLFTAILILICDQTTNLFKYSFERLRPCNDPHVQDLLTNFSLITHGFGSPALTAAVDVFHQYLTEMLKYYEKNYPMFIATTSTSSSSIKNGGGGID